MKTILFLMLLVLALAMTGCAAIHNFGMGPEVVKHDGPENHGDTETQRNQE